MRRLIQYQDRTVGLAPLDIISPSGEPQVPNTQQSVVIQTYAVPYQAIAFVKFTAQAVTDFPPPSAFHNGRLLRATMPTADLEEFSSIEPSPAAAPQGAAGYFDTRVQRLFANVDVQKSSPIVLTAAAKPQGGAGYFDVRYWRYFPTADLEEFASIEPTPPAVTPVPQTQQNILFQTLVVHQAPQWQPMGNVPTADTPQGWWQPLAEAKWPKLTASLQQWAANDLPYPQQAAVVTTVEGWRVLWPDPRRQVPPEADHSVVATPAAFQAAPWLAVEGRPLVWRLARPDPFASPFLAPAAFYGLIQGIEGDDSVPPPRQRRRVDYAAWPWRAPFADPTGGANAFFDQRMLRATLPVADLEEFASFEPSPFTQPSGASGFFDGRQPGRPFPMVDLEEFSGFDPSGQVPSPTTPYGWWVPLSERIIKPLASSQQQHTFWPSNTPPATVSTPSELGWPMQFDRARWPRNLPDRFWGFQALGTIVSTTPQGWWPQYDAPRFLRGRIPLDDLPEALTPFAFFSVAWMSPLAARIIKPVTVRDDQPEPLTAFPTFTTAWQQPFPVSARRPFAPADQPQVSSPQVVVYQEGWRPQYDVPTRRRLQILLDDQPEPLTALAFFTLAWQQPQPEPRRRARPHLLEAPPFIGPYVVQVTWGWYGEQPVARARRAPFEDRMLMRFIAPVQNTTTSGWHPWAWLDVPRFRFKFNVALQMWESRSQAPFPTIIGRPHLTGLDAQPQLTGLDDAPVLSGVYGNIVLTGKVE